MQFPLAHADRLERLTFVKQQRFVGRPSLRVAAEQRTDVAAIQPPLGFGAARKLLNGRQQVDCRGRFAADLAGGDHARPLGNHRHAHAAFERRQFSLSQFARRACVFAVGQERTVV